MTFLQIIADYGTGDPAFGEVIQRFQHHGDDPAIHHTAVPPFSTINTGFWIQQYACNNPAPDDMAIFANTAPRTNSTEPQPDGAGEALCYGEIDGIPVIAVNAGHTFSFVKDDLDTLHTVEVPNSGSQFRSRDYYPEAVIDLLSGPEERLDASIDTEMIPDPPDQAIAHIDGYGNIKTTIRASEAPETDQAIVMIDGTRQTVTLARGGFGVEPGQLAFAPGSSGGTDPYMELFLRGGSAADRFGSPEIGSRIELKATGAT